MHAWMLHDDATWHCCNRSLTADLAVPAACLPACLLACLPACLLACLLPVAVLQEARGKLQELYGQVRALDLENAGGLTGEMLAEEGFVAPLGCPPACLPS